jgi:DNA primase
MSSILDEVLERVNILDIVSQYVKLRKAGRNFLGLCPFHKEKTPSFTVSTEKQIYYCFGCHEGGNAVNFVAKYERSTFHEALESLATQLGIETHRGTGARRKPVFDALSRLADHYHENLLRSSLAMKYLADRQIDRQTVDDFKLGYSERKIYGKDFAERLGAPLDALFSAGILKAREGGETYDVFRGRVVIPIFDINGKVIGFGGRAMGKDVLPKYINSSESPVFSKRSVLYGLNRAKREIADRDEAIIVEGYFDLISLHRAGIENAVATLGTSVTEEQIARLRNYSENITLMLDGDEAGIKSALRLITLFGEMGINGNMVVLPDGHDPDSFVRTAGKAGFITVIREKKPLLDYFFDFSVRKHGLKTLEGKIGFIGSVLPYIEGIKDPVRRRLYVQRLSDLTGVEEDIFLDKLRTVRFENVGTDAEKSRSAIEEKVVGIVINRPEFIESLEGKGMEERIKDKDLGELLAKILDYYRANASLDLKIFLNVLDRTELREKAMRAAMDVADCDEHEMERILTDYLYHMQNTLIREEAKGITERLAEAERRGDEKALRELLEKKREVVAAMKYKSAK